MIINYGEGGFFNTNIEGFFVQIEDSYEKVQVLKGGDHPTP